MMMRRIVPSLVALAVIPAAAIAWQQSMSQGPRVVQREPASVVLGTDAELRAQGPEGLRTLLAQYDRTKDASLLSRIDSVAGQHDAVWSRLYWYTDLEQAKAAAKAEHKPILYLRLLGKLTDEYSCANSRFFRTVLYANESVSKLMREKFVLVWESERPVPVVTIDMGDGRVLKRTITGNSIHYVLDVDGHVVDAIPGLYDPATFASVLTAAIEPSTSGTAVARAAHLADANQAIVRDVQRDFEATRAGAPAPAVFTPVSEKATAADAAVTTEAKRRVESPVLTTVEAGRRGGAPSAVAAGAVSPAKLEVEQPIVKAVAAKSSAPDAADASGRAFGKTMVERPLVNAAVRPIVFDDLGWEELAVAHVAFVHLDDQSMALMRSHNPAYVDPAVFGRAVEQFRTSIAQDTVRNQYDFRVKIIGWLGKTPEITLEALNTRVYSELFLTPRSDTWLGLKSDDVYSALPGDGCPAN
ncbi:MAG: hypothetical protein QM783_09785 [Phycisphaerales bacterium]